MIQNFIKNENGAMSIEAAIITAVLVGCAILFRKQLSSLWEAVAEKNEDMAERIRNGG